MFLGNSLDDMSKKAIFL